MGTNAKVGYIRVSTVEQNEARQREMLAKQKLDKIFEEKTSGKTADRPQLQAMIDYVREGDTVYIESFSRLARNTKDLLEICDKLDKKGVSIVSDKEKLDTTTATGRLMLTMIGAIASFEREIMLERQAEGIAIAKAAGKFKGRKPKAKPANWDSLYQRYMKREISLAALAREAGCNRNTAYKWVKEK